MNRWNTRGMASRTRAGRATQWAWPMAVALMAVWVSAWMADEAQAQQPGRRVRPGRPAARAAGQAQPPAETGANPEGAAQDAAGGAVAGKSALGDKQSVIRDRVKRLEDRMFELGKALEKSEPQHAAKLIKALGATRSLAVRAKMDEIIGKLNEERLSDAADRQKAVADDLRQLLQILVEEEDKTAERKKEMDRIKAMREALKKIIAEQEKEKADAEAAAAMQRAAEALEAAAKDVRALLDRQKKVTGQAGAADDPQAQAQASGDQAALRKDAEKVADRLDRAGGAEGAKEGEPPEGGAKEGAAPGDGAKEGDTKESGEKESGAPGESGANGENSPNGKPDGEGAGESKAQGDKPEGEAGQSGQSGKSSESSGQQGNESPGQQSSGQQGSNSSGQQGSESSPSGSQAGGSGGQSPTEVARQAGQDVRKASEKMKSAEEGLQKGQGNAAKDAQQGAEQDLERAAKRLEGEAQALRNKLKLEGDAKRQRDTRDKTEKLSDEMKGDQKGDQAGGESGGQSGGKSGGEKGGEQGDQQDGNQKGDQKGDPSGGDQQGGKQGGKKGGQQGGQQGGDQQDGQQGGQEEQPAPGQQDVEGAIPLQEDAAKKLEQKNPEEAAKKQEQALKKLKEAKDQMEDVLEQMRKEQQEELLAALEARLRAMLAQQLEVNKGTAHLESIGSANWKRSDQLELADLSKKQRWVGDQADQTLQILVEEGTTVVFPQIIEQVRDDGRDVANRIASADVGAGVQAIQGQIEQAIRDLLGAVKKMQEELQQNKGGGGGGGGNQPLLPGSAELKLLRACQLRVNSATESLQSDKLRPEVPSADVQSRLDKLSKRQQDVAKMAKEMHEAVNRAQ